MTSNSNTWKYAKIGISYWIMSIHFIKEQSNCFNIRVYMWGNEQSARGLWLSFCLLYMYIYVNLWANSTKSTLLKPKWEWMRYNYILEKNDIFTNVYKKNVKKMMKMKNYTSKSTSTYNALWTGVEV